MRSKKEVSGGNQVNKQTIYIALKSTNEQGRIMLQSPHRAMTLTYKCDLDMVKLNHHGSCCAQTDMVVRVHLPDHTGRRGR